MGTLNDVLDLLKQMQENMGSMTNRIGALETGESTKKESVGDERDENTVVTSMVREKQLTKTFGTDTSSEALLEFLDHYKLCVEMNQQRRAPGWGDAKYRAKELRYQLQGEAGVFVRQEEAMHESWVEDDNKIIEKLKERWLNRDCIELDIIQFEEARQNDGESLGQFMQRLKGLGQRAFSEFDSTGMQQRIIWRFLDGVRDKDIRSSIIKERWMRDRKTPKPYAEVLKIAETAHLNKIAANATGGTGLPVKKVAVVSKDGLRDGLRTPKSTRGGKNKTNNKVVAAGTSFDCHFCHENHPGGWRHCEDRKRKNPDWTPRTAGRNSSGESSNSVSPAGSVASANSNQAF